MTQNTLGQRRVGLDFNPSGSDTIRRVKVKTADLIDLVMGIPIGEAPDRTEIVRLKEQAAKAYEEAAMWAVKAAVRSREAGQIVE